MPIEPPEPPKSNPPAPPADDPAVGLIRQKLAALYQAEPNAGEELAEVAQEQRPLSKHQKFIYDLNNSGKSLVDIQTAWHEYYTGLPEPEKHEVWQEFYAAHAQASHFSRASKPPAPAQPEPIKPVALTPPPRPKPRRPKQNPRTVADIKQQLLKHVGAPRGKLKAKHHIQSLLFGMGMGGMVIVILLFSFFNERFIAPFVTPSRAVSNTPIIIDPNDGGVVSPDPKLIIPKINVEIPVVYDVPTIEESAVETGLERGVVHYATTPNPGEKGNGVIFGHSSNNILNKGKYKFAFVLLKRLEAGDTFIIQKASKRFVYRVFDKKIVKPEDVSVLNDNHGKPATFTLITCDPPGTSINRLIVTGEQISPDPTANTASTAAPAAPVKTLAGNAPSLWSRLTGWFTH